MSWIVIRNKLKDSNNIWSKKVWKAWKYTWVISIKWIISVISFSWLILMWMISISKWVEPEWIWIVLPLLIMLSLLPRHLLLKFIYWLLKSFKFFIDLFNRSNCLLIFTSRFLSFLNFINPFLNCLYLLLWIESDFFNFSIYNIADEQA